MKTAFLILALTGLGLTAPKTAQVDPKVYSFSDTKTAKTEYGYSRLMIDGNTVQMSDFEIAANTLEPGKSFADNNKNLDFERLIVVKEGKLKVSSGSKSEDLGPGSVALIMPGDRCEVENTGLLPATCYAIKYKSRQPVVQSRGAEAGGSALLNWDDLKFTPHDKGGIRRYFDRKSAMSDRVEMHVTTLNPHLESHPPHTHVPAEIIVMMKGKTEMEIGGKNFPGNVGDIYFLESNVPHGIYNTGEEPCMYMAFQWQ